MHLREFLVVAVAHFLALLSPGPDFFLLVGNTVRRGLRAGAGTALGIGLANAVYIGVALLGFDMLAFNPWLRELLKVAGGGYLLWVGWKFVGWGRAESGSALRAMKAGAGSHPTTGFWAGMAMGFGSGILNPKNGVFYLGLFAALVNPRTPMYWRIGYGAWMTGLVIAWDLALAKTLCAEAVFCVVEQHLRHVEMVAGTCLMALAGVMVISAF